MDRSSFDNVKEQVGHCGLWCGSCIIGNGLLAEMTSQYQRVACGHGVHKWVLKEKGAAFVESLEELKKVPICPGCLKGGGDDTCRIRECARDRGLVHCDECGPREDCSYQKNITFMHEGGKAAGMLVFSSKEDRGRCFDEICKSYLESYPGDLLNEL